MEALCKHDGKIFSDGLGKECKLAILTNTILTQGKHSWLCQEDEMHSCRLSINSSLQICKDLSSEHPLVDFSNHFDDAAQLNKAGYLIS